MRLRTKLFLLLAMLMAVLAVGIFSSFRLEMRSTSEVSAARARELATLFDAVLDAEGRSLSAMVDVETYWDDFVAFVRNPEMSWAKENLDPVVSNGQADAIWAYGTDGRERYSVLGSRALAADPALSPLREADVLKQLHEKRGLHYFVRAANSVMECWAATIHPSDDAKRTGPPQGYFIAGRVWTHADVNRLAARIHAAASFAAPEEVPPHAAQGHVTFQHVFRQLDGQPAAVVFFSAQDDLLHGARQRSLTLLLITTTCALLAFWLVAAGLYRLVGEPTEALSRSLHERSPMPLTGLRSRRDEFGSLARLVMRFFAQQQQLEADVAERELAQREIERLNCDLEARVKQRTAALETSRAQLEREVERQRRTARDLEAAKAAAEDALRAKGEFLANMSHEIRTPMNAVIGMTDLMLGTKLDNEQREYAGTIRQSGQHLLMLINDILDFSKIEAGRLELVSMEFDPAVSLECAVDLLAAQAEAKQIGLAAVIEGPSPCLAMGDPGRLQQVFVNLLSNAVKFTDVGEVVATLSSRPADGRVELRLDVRDSGIGIAPEIAGRLFTPFEQGDASATRRFGGTGLGLAISKRIIDTMGGQIWLKSSGVAGEGTTFSLTVALPAIERPQDAAAFPGKSLIVVDPNSSVRAAVTHCAERWQMRVVSCQSGAEASELLQTMRPDVVVFRSGSDAAGVLALARRLGASPLVLAPFTHATPLPAGLVTTRWPVRRGELHAAIQHALRPDSTRAIPDGTRAIPDATPAAPRPAASDLASLGGRIPLRILLVEDNNVNQRLMMRVLEKLGYAADLACNGQEAVDAVAAKAYDLVIMDLQMPVKDGLTATREIRASHGTERPYIAAMTANAFESDRRDCAEAGMNDFLSKPVRPSEVAQMIERCGAVVHGAAATS